MPPRPTSKPVLTAAQSCADEDRLSALNEQFILLVRRRRVPARLYCAAQCDERHLRPGGTGVRPSRSRWPISAVMSASLARRPDALSVTVNLDITLRPQGRGRPIRRPCRILKLGKSLMVFRYRHRRRARWAYNRACHPAPIRSRRSGMASGKNNTFTQAIVFCIFLCAVVLFPALTPTTALAKAHHEGSGPQRPPFFCALSSIQATRNAFHL